MYEIGDIVLHDVYVGVVVDSGEKILTCNCSDGKVRKLATGSVSLIGSYKTMLESFRKGIMANVSG